MTQHPSYPDETTRRHLLALTKAGVIKPGSIRAQVAEAVDMLRLVMEAADGSAKPKPACDHPRSFTFNGTRRCSKCGEILSQIRFECPLCGGINCHVAGCVY